MSKSREPIIRIVGRSSYSANIGVGANIDSLQLNDSINTQLSSLSDMYGLYRFTHIRLVQPAGIQTNSASAPGLYGVGFTPEVLLALPTTLAEAVQLPFWCGHQLFISTGSNVLMWGSSDHQSFTVPRKDLMKVGVKWFRTQGRGTESDWESQGTFIFAVTTAPATTAHVFRGWIEYVCEFTDQLPLTATRERLLKDARREAAHELMSKLAITADSKEAQPGSRESPAKDPPLAPHAARHEGN